MFLRSRWMTLAVDAEAPTEIGDYDHDGAPDLIVKFDRAEVISYILANTEATNKFGKSH